MWTGVESEASRIAAPTHAQAPLRPARAAGWGAGFDNLLRKELHQWWWTRNWLALLLFLLVMIDGVTVVAGGPPSQAHTAAVELRYMKAVSVFFLFGPLFAAIRAITSMQGALVDERQSGTAPWILSKPVARTAFIGAKLAASAVTFVAVGVVAPAAVFYGLCIPMWGRTPDVAPYLEALPVLALHLLFYLALTVLLGTFLSARGAVAAVASGVAFVGSFIGSALPAGAQMTPWGLPHLALSLATEQPLPDGWVVAVVTTVALTLACMVATIWRIGREEF